MAAELLVCWIDRDQDRASASNGVSRYGAYLELHAALFDPWHEAPDGVTRDPVEFAVAAYAHRAIHIRDGQVEKDVRRAA